MNLIFIIPFAIFCVEMIAGVPVREVSNTEIEQLEPILAETQKLKAMFQRYKRVRIWKNCNVGTK